MARKKSEELGLFDQSIAIGQLVDLVESIRLSRRERWATQRHPLQKRFSQEELRDLVPSYKNLMIGRTKRLPSRTVVLQIAEYLECEQHETNALLQAAEYAPLPLMWSDAQYQRALEFGRTLLNGISLPAQLVSYGWYAEAVNSAFQRVNSLPSIELLPFEKRCAIHCFFNRESPYFPMYSPSIEYKRSNFSSLIAFFRQIHNPFVHEHSYQDMIDQFDQLPEFRQAWSTSHNFQEQDAGKTVFLQPGYSSLLTEQWVRVPLSEAAFPLILMTIPLNDAAREVYRAYDAYSV
jgi:hypothetical protein